MASTTRRSIKNVRINDELYEDITAIAEKEHTTVVDIVDRALRMYRDWSYMENKAYAIPDDLLRSIRAELELNSHRQNNRLNTLLSQIAISNYVITKTVAASLDFDANTIERFRMEAIEQMKDGQRIFTLTDFTGV